MPFKYLSLSSRIFFSLAFILMTALIVFSSISLYHIKTRSHTQNEAAIKKELSAIGMSVNFALRGAGTLSPSLFTDRSRTDEIDLAASSSNIGIDIYDKNGTHLYKASQDYQSLYYGNDSGIPRTGQGLPPSVISSLDSLGGTLRIKEGSADNMPVIGFYTALYSPEGRMTGIMRILYPEETYFNASDITPLREKLSLTLIALLAVSLIAAVLIARGITRPIKRLGDNMSGITADRGQDIEYSGVPDLRPLVNAYNSMLERIRESSRKMAQSERERAWDEMAKIVAHEIKNPLTPMRLSVQSYLMTFDPKAPDANERAAELCSVLIEQIDALSQIASSFSDFSRSERSAHGSCDLSEILPLAAGIYKSRYVSTEVPSRPLYVPLDKTAIVQIVSNLIKNAMEAVRSGTQPEISITLADDGSGHAVLTVSDNGSGIPEEIIGQIFNPSFTTKSSGTGMGLAVTSRIITSAGGTISCRSDKEHGTTFTIILPLLRGTGPVNAEK